MLREAGRPLWALESGDPLSAFDVVGITLQYELTFTGVLGLLELGGIPLRSSERTDSDPIVSPEWKGSLGIQYKATLGNGSSLTPRIDANYTGETSAGRVAAGGPIDYYDSYTLTNARLTWRNADEDLSIALEAHNVFDEYYQPFRFAAVYGFSGTIYSQVGRPLEYAISISKKF